MTRKDLLIKEHGQNAVDFIDKYISITNPLTLLLKTEDVFNIEILDEGSYESIVNLRKINDLHSINKFLSTTNNKLKDGGIYITYFETHTERNKRLFKKYPFLIAQIYLFFDFMFKRVFPKLWLTRWLYFFITAGRNRVLSKAEALGRLVFNGFDIEEVIELNNLTYVACKKTQREIPTQTPSFGFLFKMKRVGKNNELITVYKIRTMHPYAEFIQGYIFETNNLRDGGKINNDYRITSWGRIFRKLWIDELPMFINFFKRELKLVGVRPLSSHYLSLYSDELKQKRLLIKPGLIPPFYADLPITLEEIMQSELNYINQYLQKPITTDVKYFFVSLKNIVLKKGKTN